MKAFHEVRNYNADLKVWSSQYTNISLDVYKRQLQHITHMPYQKHSAGQTQY